MAKASRPDRTFEDVIFGAILSVWSVNVKRLWEVNAPWHLPIAFLATAGLLALALRILWRVSPLWIRFLAYGWMLLIIWFVSYFAVRGRLFSSEEGWVFALVFVAWSTTGLIGDLLSKLIPAEEV